MTSSPALLEAEMSDIEEEEVSFPYTALLPEGPDICQEWGPVGATLLQKCFEGQSSFIQICFFLEAKGSPLG